MILSVTIKFLTCLHMRCQNETAVMDYAIETCQMTCRNFYQPFFDALLQNTQPFDGKYHGHSVLCLGGKKHELT